MCSSTVKEPENIRHLLWECEHTKKLLGDVKTGALKTTFFCCGSLVILDVARWYLWLFTLYINIKIGKNSC